MRYLLLVFACLGCALASTTEEKDFKSFTSKFRKLYKDAGEMEYRREIFQDNYGQMVDHNKRFAAGQVSWSQKVTSDMDLTEQEFIELRLSGIPDYMDMQSTNSEIMLRNSLPKMMDPPVNFSWVDAGAVTPAKDQGRCGSCTAFAVMGGIESCCIIQAQHTADLAEQQLVDCAYDHYVDDESGNWGAFGCHGAWANAYLDWIIQDQTPLQFESAYPYTSGTSGDNGDCSPDPAGYDEKCQVTGMFNQWYTQEEDMVDLLFINPIITAVQATPNWVNYSEGILEDPVCCNADTDENCVNRMSHMVLVVGYGPGYWLIKNSWGESWGMAGLGKLKRGTGHCGIGCLHQTIPYCASPARA